MRGDFRRLIPIGSDEDEIALKFSRSIPLFVSSIGAEEEIGQLAQRLCYKKFIF